MISNGVDEVIDNTRSVVQKFQTTPRIVAGVGDTNLISYASSWYGFAGVGLNMNGPISPKSHSIIY